MDKFLFIRNSDTIKRINTDHVICIMVEGDCITIFETGNKKFIVSKSLREIAVLLPENFHRISRNMIVNTDRIAEVNVKSRTVLLDEGKKLIVSTRNMKTLIAHLSGKNER